MKTSELKKIEVFFIEKKKKKQFFIVFRKIIKQNFINRIVIKKYEISEDEYTNLKKIL